MNTGDTVVLRRLADEFPARVLESDKYRGAYILRVRFRDNKEAYCTVFPDLPMLPPASWFTSDLYVFCGWLDWRDRTFPMPVGRGRPLPGVDMRRVMRQRIDLILDFHKRWADGTTPMIELTPHTDGEREQFKRLAQYSGEV